MSTNAIARIVITAVTAACIGLSAYAIPTYVTENWRWRLLALPAAILSGLLAWWRYGSRPVVDPLIDGNVSTTSRIAVTVGAVLIGICGGVFIPFVLTRTAPAWSVVAPLAMSLALILGLCAWHNPALFFKNRRF